MDNNVKAIIDECTDIEYRFGRTSGQIASVVAMCEYELIEKSKERWNKDIDDVKVPATLVLHMLERDIPPKIRELYEKETLKGDDVKDDNSDTEGSGD